MINKFFWLIIVVSLICIGIFWFGFWGKKNGERADGISGNKEDDIASSTFTLHSEVLETPPIESHSFSLFNRFVFSPDGLRLAAALEDCGFLRIYATDYPPQGASDYRKVVDIPNICFPSNIAWCRENPTKLAFAAHFFAGPPLPEFRDEDEYRQWRRSHPDRFPKGSISVVQSDKRIERRIAIVSTADGSCKKDIEFPAVDGATNLGSICWPKKNTIFYNYGNTIFRVDLNSSPPKISAIYTADDKTLHIFHLDYDSVNDFLLCFKLRPRNHNQRGKLNYERLCLNGEGQVMKTITNIPFSETSISAVYGQDGTKCLVLGKDPGKESLYYGDLLNDRWQKMPLEAEPGAPRIMYLNAFDSGKNTAIVTITDFGAGGLGYRRLSFTEKQPK